MSEEILVNTSPTETRIAVVENGVLQEVHIERTQRQGYVGKIYKGRVARVLPGMQAAFVDIGLDKAGFIHASDVLSLGERKDEESRSEPEDISRVLREGQDLVVQVVKDPIGTKGARLTTHLSVSARYLVYMPYHSHLGISARIENEDERLRLKGIVESDLLARDEAHSGGFIIRTVAEGVEAAELCSDIPFLYQLWADIEDKINKAQVKTSVYEDLPLSQRTLRDFVRPHIEKIRVDSREVLGKMQRFSQKYAPEIHSRLEHYPGERPIFELYCVEDEIQRALECNVPLKSGGYLVIDQTEAMTTVDVNTGGFVGHRNLEETIFKTNLEAATAIARQLRLRNLGGIVILDFIDMKDPEHQNSVLRTLEKLMERDHAKTSISGVSGLGLVEMTRKRTRESLGQMMCEPCSTCNGRGALKSAETICYEIFREVLREARAYNNKKFLVLASQVVIERLLDEESTNVADLEEFISCSIRFQVESVYSQEQYDIILV
jgi:ribonuclease G